MEVTPGPVPPAQEALPIVSSTAHWTSALISLSDMPQSPLLASLLWSLGLSFSSQASQPKPGLNLVSSGPRSLPGMELVTSHLGLPSGSFLPCALIWGGAICGTGHRDVKQQGVAKSAVDSWLILCHGGGGQGWASGHCRGTGRGCN